MGLAAGQAEFRQYVKNLPTLDFHLAREIVDSNLTHPPLFKICFPNPLVAHGYLMELAALQTCIARLAFKVPAHATRRPLWPPAHPIFHFLFQSLPEAAPARFLNLLQALRQVGLP